MQFFPRHALVSDITSFDEKGGPAYRAVMRLKDAPAANGCVQITLMYQVEYANPAPPMKFLTVSVPVQYRENGDSPTAPVYQADIYVP